jgi:hypothetical protein
MTNTTKTTVKLRKALHAQTKTTTHNYQKEKRMPKYDSQSETTIDSCPWLRTIPRQNIETNNIECPPHITPWPNQTEKYNGSLRSGRDSQSNPNGSLRSGRDSQSNPNGSLRSGRDSQSNPNGELRSGRDSQSNPNGELRSGRDSQSNPNGSLRSGRDSQSNPNGELRSVVVWQHCFLSMCLFRHIVNQRAFPTYCSPPLCSS